MNKVFFFLVFSLSVSVQAQLNMTLVSQVSYQNLHQANLNDCWGYVDETGIEYALVGTTKGTSVVSLQNPQVPVEVDWIPGSESIWRDLQVYGDYAYITTEAQDGLLIVDLSPLPASFNLPTAIYTGPATNSWQRAHDIFIDTAGGWAYICGANRGNGGLIILDIHTNPMAPVEVGTFDNWYCHDAFAHGNKLYGAHIADGFMSVLDVTDHTNPVLLNTQITPNSFTHNVWVTANDQYAVTTDEVSNAYLALYDVSNPLIIRETDRVQSSPGLNIIPHNAFILHDSLIVASYYTDGITVFNMSRPYNLVEVASYDTHPLENGTFNGSWGAYCYLPSGLLLASDISEGLFVLDPTLVAPSYYEGLVRDASNLQPLPDVQVSIQNDLQTDVSNFQGEWAVGTVENGTKNVTFYKVAYEVQTITVPFVNGQLLLDTVDLVPIVPVPVTVLVVEAATGNPIVGADVQLKVPQMTQNDQTNGFGESNFNCYYPGINSISAGKWGYVTQCADTVLDSAHATIIVRLEKGIYDDFTFDFGWTSTYSNATSGFWERGIPFYNQTTSTPLSDAGYDCNNSCYITGNQLTLDANADDVDNGTVLLLSPVFDLTTFSDPYVNYHRWFFNYHGPNLFDDSLVIRLSNGMQTVTIDTVSPGTYYPQWVPKSIRVADYGTPTANMQLIVSTADTEPNGNITEAAFDYFHVTEGSVADLHEAEGQQWRMFPNPALSDEVHLQTDIPGFLRIYSAAGQLLRTEKVTDKYTAINVRDLDAGLYLVEFNHLVKRFIKE